MTSFKQTLVNIGAGVVMILNRIHEEILQDEMNQLV